MTASSGSIAVLLDTRSDEPVPYLTTALESVGRLTGFDRLQLFKQPAPVAPTLCQRRQEERQWQEAVDAWNDPGKRQAYAAKVEDQWQKAMAACSDPERKKILDEKRQQQPKAVRAWKHRSNIQCELFYDLHSVSTGPCEDWFKNIWLAFENPKVERIIYLPYDITYTPEGRDGKPASPDLVGKLQSFLDEASKADADLLLGTYHATTGGNADIPKNHLEHFTILELFRCFPETMKRLGWTGWDNHKPRTGYFALSRRLYEQFRKRPRFRQVMMPYGGTFQLILCAALVTHATEMQLPGAKQKFLIREWGPIMDVCEPPMVPMDFRVGHQRIRTWFVMEDERMYWSRLWPALPL